MINDPQRSKTHERPDPKTNAPPPRRDKRLQERTMNTESLRAALEADTDGWGEPWRRHVRVLQEYVGELNEVLAEYEAEADVHETDFGNIERPGQGFPGPQHQTEGWRPNRKQNTQKEQERVKTLRDERIKSPPVSTESGEVEELSEVERQEMGYPASRAGLIDILHSVISDIREFGHITLATEEMIQEILSREGSTNSE